MVLNYERRCAELAAIISGYRMGEGIPQMNAEYVEKWISQLDPDVQEVILENIGERQHYKYIKYLKKI